MIKLKHEAIVDLDKLNNLYEGFRKFYYQMQDLDKQWLLKQNPELLLEFIMIEKQFYNNSFIQIQDILKVDQKDGNDVKKNFFLQQNIDINWYQSLLEGMELSHKINFQQMIEESKQTGITLNLITLYWLSQMNE